jgi:hypothetical protein
MSRFDAIADFLAAFVLIFGGAVIVSLATYL